jgi:hypothetical protein
LIGDFLFSESQVPDQIQVELLYDLDGNRAAQLIVPESVQEGMAASDYPAVHGTMAVDSALAYAIILAARSERSLILTGDPSVWDPSWGHLVEVEMSVSIDQLTARLD